MDEAAEDGFGLVARVLASEAMARGACDLGGEAAVELLSKAKRLRQRLKLCVPATSLSDALKLMLQSVPTAVLD